MAKYSKEQRDRAMDLYIRYERCAADVDWLQCIRQSDEGRMTWDWRPTMAGPKHPRHHGEAFKRQIAQSCESGKPSREIRAEYDIARSTPRCRYSHEGRRDTGQHRPLPDISAMQDAGRSPLHLLLDDRASRDGACGLCFCKLVSTVWALFQQRRRLVSSRNCAVGTRRPFLPGYLVMRACSLR